jgi:ketosteroid isomerase-like protein
MAGRTPEETDRLINEAISTGNAEAAAQLYEPDGVLVLPGQPEARGREAIQQTFIEFLRTKPTLTGTIRHMVIAGDASRSWRSAPWRSRAGSSAARQSRCEVTPAPESDPRRDRPPHGSINALPRMTQRVLSRARVYVYDLTSDQEDRRPDNLRRAVAWLLLLFGEAVKFTQNPASRTLLTFRLARKRRSGLRSGAGIENSEWHGLPSAGFFRTCLLVPPSRIPFARAHSLSDLQTNGCIHKDTPTFLRSCRPIPSCPRTRSSSGRVSEPLKLGPGGNRVPPGSIKVRLSNSGGVFRACARSRS